MGRERRELDVTTIAAKSVGPLTVAIAGLVLSACFLRFPSHPSPLAACTEVLGRPAASGALQILPSSVANVRIDSARWGAQTSSPELDTHTSVSYVAYLSSTTTVPLPSIAVQFRSNRAGEDTFLVAKGDKFPIVKSYGLEMRLVRDYVRPGEVRMASAGMRMKGEHTAPWGCPISAQLIPRSDSVREGTASERQLDLAVRGGVKLKATYYSAGKPGPGMLLLHQCNMDRKSWTEFGSKLAERGVHALAIDYRGYGESPAARDGQADLPHDVDAALSALAALPGVDGARLGAAGASCGVENAVALAKRSGRLKALVLLSGPISLDGLSYLKEHPEMLTFAAYSAEDKSGLTTLVDALYASRNRESELRELEAAGHGTVMFGGNRMLLTDLSYWVAEVLRASPVPPGKPTGVVPPGVPMRPPLRQPPPIDRKTRPD